MAKKKEAKDVSPAVDEVIEAAEESAEEIDAEVAAATPEEQLQAALDEAAGNKDLYLRALADLENYRKRAQREKEDAIRFANDNLLRNTIPVLDNLERAVEHARKSGEEQGGLLEGVEMTLSQFHKVLEAAGVCKVASLGAPFDPNFHQAMGQIPTGEHPPNTVVQELQKGYLLNERLLRPALVMVASVPPTDASTMENGPDDAPAAADE